MEGIITSIIATKINLWSMMDSTVRESANNIVVAVVEVIAVRQEMVGTCMSKNVRSVAKWTSKKQMINDKIRINKQP